MIGADGRVIRALTRDGRALAPGRVGRGEVALRDRARRRVRCRRPFPSTASRGRSGVRTPTTPGTRSGRPTDRALVWHEWDLPDMPWDASRIIVRDDDGAPRRSSPAATRSASANPGSRPTAARLAFVSDADGWPVVWTSDPTADRSRCSRRPRARRAGVGPGPTLVRVVTRRDADRMVPERGRLRPAGDRCAGPQVGARAVEGLAPRTRLERRAGIACVRSGAVTPAQVVVLAAERFGSPRRSRAVRSAGSKRRRLVEPRRSRGSAAARTCTGCCGARPTRDAAAARRASCTAARPARRSPTGTRGCSGSCSTVARCCSRTTAVRPGYGAPTRSALDGRWGERDVADVAAGIRHAVKEGWCDPNRIVLMGGSAGGFTALLVAAKHPDLVARRDRAVSRSPICSTSRRRRTASSRATTCASSVRCPTPRTATSRTLAAHARRRDPRAGAVAARRPTDTIGAADAVGRARRRAARAGTPSSGTCTRARATVGAGPRRSPTSSRASTRSSRAWVDCAMSAADLEYQGPKRGAGSRGAARARRGRRHARGGADDRRRRAGRRQDPVAAVQLPVQGRGPAGARPAAGARGRGARGRGRAGGAGQGAARPARARRPLDGRPHRSMVAADATTVPRSGSCCSAIRCTRRASRRRCASSTSRDLRDAGAVRERNARDAFGTPDELQRHAKKIKGPVDVPLDRDGRPRLQAAEIERPDGRCRARRGGGRGRALRRQPVTSDYGVARVRCRVSTVVSSSILEPLLHDVADADDADSFPR